MDQAVHLLPRYASPDGDGAAGSQPVPDASGRARARRRLDPEPGPGRPAVSVRQSVGSRVGPTRRGCAGPPAPTAAGRADPPGGQGGAGEAGRDAAAGVHAAVAMRSWSGTGREASWKATKRLDEGSAWFDRTLGSPGGEDAHR